MQESASPSPFRSFRERHLARPAPPPKRRWVWRLLAWAGLSTASLLILGIGLGFLYQDELEALAAKQLGHYLNADIRIERIDVSFLRHWPLLEVELNDLSIRLTETSRQEAATGEPLALAANSLSFRLNLWAFFQGEHRIEAIELNDAYLRIEQTAADKLNWEFILANILNKDPESPSSSAGIHLALKRLSLTQATIVYAAGKTKAMLEETDLLLAGDFTAKRFLLDTELDGQLAYLRQGRSAWLQDESLQLRSAVRIESGEGRYTLQSTQLQLADLRVSLAGAFTQPDSAAPLQTDLKIRTGKIAYGKLMSLLPPSFDDELAAWQPRGTARLSGRWHGRLGQGHQPILELSAQVRDGSLALPEKNLENLAKGTGLHDLHFGAQVHWTPGAPANSYVKLNDLSGRLGREPLTGRFELTNFDAPHLDLQLKGELGLDRLAPLLGPSLPAKASLSGSARLKLRARGKLADFRAQRVGRTDFQGEVVLKQAGYDSPSKHLADVSGALRINKLVAEAGNLQGKLNGSRFQLSGRLTNLWPYLLQDQALQAKADLRVGRFDLAAWQDARPENDAASTPKPSTADTAQFRWPKRLNLHLSAHCERFAYDRFEATGVRAELDATQAGIAIEQLQMNAFHGGMHLKGQLSPGTWQVNTRLDGVDVAAFFQSFPQLAELSGIGPHLSGKLNSRFQLQATPAKGYEFDPASIRAEGSLRLVDGAIDNYQPLVDMAGFVKLKNFRHVRFGHVSADFNVRDESFHVQNAVLEANKLGITADGEQHFSGAVDFQLAITWLGQRWDGPKNEMAAAWVESTRDDRLHPQAFLRMSGTVDDPQLRPDGKRMRQKMAGDLAREGQEAAKSFRKAGKTLFGEQKSAETENWIHEE